MTPGGRPWWRSLSVQITLAFVLLSLLTLSVVGLSALNYTNRQYASLLRGRTQDDFVTSVQQYLTTHDSLAGYERPRPGEPVRPFTDAQANRPPPPPRVPRRSAGGSPPPSRPPFLVLDGQRRVVAGDERHGVGSQLDASPDLIPVPVNGQTVAFLVPTGRPLNLDARSAAFLTSTGRGVALVMLAAALVAVLVGIGISRALLSPLRTLLRAIRAMQGGDETVALPVRRPDELGEVLVAFGQMWDTVARTQRARRQLTADIAHDLNTPLAALCLSLEGLADGTFAPTRERFDRLLRSAGQLSNLVRDLRFLSLADAGELPLQLGAVDVCNVGRDALAHVHSLAERQAVTVMDALPAGPLWARADAPRVMQVLNNLLANALKYTPAGGHVELTGHADNQWVTLVVWDTGVGIAPEQLPFVLDRLYRADAARSEGGSGLGLAICKSIVEAQGGRIHVKSTLGVGTCVQFTLPQATRPAVTTETRGADANPLSLNS